eukprot:g7897.t3
MQMDLRLHHAWRTLRHQIPDLADFAQSTRDVRISAAKAVRPGVGWVENEHELFVSGHVEAESRHLQRWWWAEQVSFASMRRCKEQKKNSSSVKYRRRHLRGEEVCVRISKKELTGPPQEFMKDSILAGKVTSYTEFREPLWPFCRFMYEGNPFYHTYALLDINFGEFQLVLERVDQKIEMLVAEGMDLLGFTQHFMACSQSRAVNGIPERTRHVKKHITVKDVLSWMGGSLASRWERYSTLFNNCQHFQAELQTLLFDESGDFQPPRGEFLNRALALETLRGGYGSADEKWVQSQLQALLRQRQSVAWEMGDQFSLGTLRSSSLPSLSADFKEQVEFYVSQLESDEAFYDDRELYFQLLSPATAPNETDDTAPYQRSEDSEEAMLAAEKLKVWTDTSPNGISNFAKLLKAQSSSALVQELGLTRLSALLAEAREQKTPAGLAPRALMPRFPRDTQVQRQGCSALRAISLAPNGGLGICLEADGAKILVQVMKSHIRDADVCRTAAASLASMVNKSQSLGQQPVDRTLGGGSSCGIFDGEQLTIPVTVPKVLVPPCGHALHTLCIGEQIIPNDSAESRGLCRQCGQPYGWTGIDVDPMVNAFCLMFGPYEMYAEKKLSTTAILSISEVCVNFSLELSGLVSPSSIWLLLLRRHAFEHPDMDPWEINSEVPRRSLTLPEGEELEVPTLVDSPAGPQSDGLDAPPMLMDEALPSLLPESLSPPSEPSDVSEDE